MASFKDFSVKTISTFLYLGYVPWCPGTLGSAAGAGLFFIARHHVPAQVLLSSGLVALGFLVSGNAEKAFDRKDAPAIIIDEVSGMLVCFLGIPYSLKTLALGFILFRIFDITKPYPAKTLQQLRGSAGIMIDDLVVAVYVNIILQILVRVTSLIAS